MKRKSKADWIEEGFRILGEFNQDKLRIQYLCERLGVTRGSFYHHFEGIEGYIQELMSDWQIRNTTKFIELAEQKLKPEQRLQVINEQVMQVNHAVEAAIRSWSFYQPIVKEAVAQVDKVRREFLQNNFKASGVGEQEAEHLALLEYATLIGIQFLRPDIQAEEMQALYESFEKRMR